MKFVQELEKLPLWVKIILALPVVDIVWMIYRLIKSAEVEDGVGIIIWIAIGVLFSWNIFWLVDIIFILMSGNPFWAKISPKK